MLQIEKYGKLKINKLLKHLKSQVVYALKPLSGLSGHTTVLMSVDVTSPVTSREFEGTPVLLKLWSAGCPAYAFYGKKPRFPIYPGGKIGR